MKKHLVILNTLLIAVTLMVGFYSCKKSSTTSFTLSSLKSGSIDMNGATSPSNIPVDPTIIAIFSLDVKASSVTAAAITLTRSYDGADIPLILSVAGSSVNIVPAVNLGSGSLYKLRFNSAITATDGQSLGALDRTFTTVGTFVPDGMIACYTFENTANDVLNHYNPKAGGVIDISYLPSFSTAAGSAGKFNGTTTLIEIPKGDSLMLTSDFTLAFWLKADSTKHGQFVMGLAGWYGFQFEIGDDYSWCKLAAQYSTSATTSASQDLYFNGKEKLADWKGYVFCKDLTNTGGVQFLLAAKWANVVCRFTSATKLATIYINGDKVKEQDYNLYDPPITQADGLRYNGAAGNKQFVFGFIQDKTSPTISDDWAQYENPANKHFKGLLDNVRIFHKSLTEQEILLMYNSEKP